MVGHKLGEFSPTRKRFHYRCVAYKVFVTNSDLRRNTVRPRTSRRTIVCACYRPSPTNVNRQNITLLRTHSPSEYPREHPCQLLLYPNSTLSRSGRADGNTRCRNDRSASRSLVQRPSISKIGHTALEAPIAVSLSPFSHRLPLRTALLACDRIDLTLEFCGHWLPCVRV